MYDPNILFLGPLTLFQIYNKFLNKMFLKLKKRFHLTPTNEASLFYLLVQRIVIFFILTDNLSFFFLTFLEYINLKLATSTVYIFHRFFLAHLS